MVSPTRLLPFKPTPDRVTIPLQFQQWKQILHDFISLPTNERQQGRAISTILLCSHLCHPSTSLQVAKRSHPEIIKNRPLSHRTTFNIRVPYSYIFCTTSCTRQHASPCALTQTSWKPWLLVQHRPALRPCTPLRVDKAGCFIRMSPDCDCAFKIRSSL